MKEKRNTLVSIEEMVDQEITLNEIIIEEEDVNEVVEDGYIEVVEQEVLEEKVVEAEAMEGTHQIQDMMEGHGHLEKNHIATNIMGNGLQSQEDILWGMKIEDLILQWLKDIHLLMMIKGTIIIKVLEGEEERQNHLLQEEAKIFFHQENQDLHLQGDLQGHEQDLHQDMIGRITVNPLECFLAVRGHEVEAIVLVNHDWQVRLVNSRVTLLRCHLIVIVELKWIVLAFLQLVISSKRNLNAEKNLLYDHFLLHRPSPQHPLMTPHQQLMRMKEKVKH